MVDLEKADLAVNNQNPDSIQQSDGATEDKAEEASIPSKTTNDTIEESPVENSERDTTNSRAPSTRSRALSTISRSKRRGLLATLTIVPEVENPYEYKNSTKWFITLVIALAAASAPLGSAIFLRTQPPSIYYNYSMLIQPFCSCPSTIIN